jgi:hypothetical protein
MGMGSVPCHAWTISSEKLREIVPAAWAGLYRQLEVAGITLDQLALARDQEIEVSESDSANDAIAHDLQVLLDAFREATRIGESFLELELHYYDAESGDRYDELESGANWLVAGVQQLTPAGVRHREVVEWKGWTVFG